MTTKNFSNGPVYSCVEEMRNFFRELELDVTETIPIMELKEFLKGKGVEVYPYITETRNFIGHKPLVSAGANVIVYGYSPNGEIEILVQKRNDISNGKYSFCGGAQEVFKYGKKFTIEPAIIAACRELIEETGVLIDQEEFVLFFNYYGFIQYENGDQILAVSTFYTVELPYDKLKELSKGESYDCGASMTHTIINAKTIDDNFITEFSLNHRVALRKFLNEFK